MVVVAFAAELTFVFVADGEIMDCPYYMPTMIPKLIIMSTKVREYMNRMRHVDYFFSQFSQMMSEGSGARAISGMLPLKTIVFVSPKHLSTSFSFSCLKKVTDYFP